MESTMVRRTCQVPVLVQLAAFFTIAIAALAIDGNCPALASAAADTFYIEIQYNGYGSVTPSGVVVVARGASQSFTFTPAACATVTEVQVDDVSLGPLTVYTFTNVQADHVLSVEFGLSPVAMSLRRCRRSVSAPAPIR